MPTLSVSPLLANVYLHYVFDLWAKQWRRREATGKVIVVRYADDIVAGFEHEADAKRFWDAMRTRFERFGLELHGEKTRLLEFGSHAAVRRRQRGLGKTETLMKEARQDLQSSIGKANDNCLHQPARQLLEHSPA